MNRFRQTCCFRLYLALLLLLITTLVTGCLWFGGESSSDKKHGNNKITHNPTVPAGLTPIVVDPSIRNVELDILNNIKSFGFNSDSQINNGLGGLYINWRYGTNPLQTNVNGSGETDDASGKSIRHDDLTDLRYLHNLWSYKVQNPTDTSFDSELSRYTSIVQHEFQNTRNERGWIYDELMDIYTLSHDNSYKDAALSLVRNYAKTFNTQIGSIYKKTSDAQGTYRVDLVMEAGCALIQAGTLEGNDDWVQKGKSVVQFIYDHAYVPQYHTFPSSMGNVVQADGSLNQNQRFFVGRSKDNYDILGQQLRMGNISQIIISLLDAYQVSHDQNLLNKAVDLLDQFSLPDSPLKMWDVREGGYFYSATFTGSSPADPGQLKIDTKRKEAGRQAIMLQAFHLANKFTNNKYKEMEKQMLDVTLQHIYNRQTHGVPYLVNADWSAPSFKNGTLNNMVTTEAMGAVLDSLFFQSR